MKKQVVVTVLAAGCIASAFSQTLPVTVRSPDTRISVHIAQDAGGQLVYSVERKGEPVIAASALRLRLAEGMSGVSMYARSGRAVSTRCTSW